MFDQEFRALYFNFQAHFKKNIYIYIKKKNTMLKEIDTFYKKSLKVK